MIIMLKDKLVFVSIARAASGSLTIACLERPQSFYILPHHRADVPIEWQHFDIFCVVRNPLHRFVSLWRNFGWNGKNKLKRKQDFAEFMEGINDNVAPAATVSFCDYVDISKANIVLRFENLPRCLSKVPAIDPKTLTHRHKSKHPIPPITKRTLKLITDRWACDFKRFGYKPCMY